MTFSDGVPHIDQPGLANQWGLRSDLGGISTIIGYLMPKFIFIYTNSSTSNNSVKYTV